MILQMLVDVLGGAKGSGISILQCQWFQRGALQLAVLIPQVAVLFPTFLVVVPALLVVVLARVPSCGYTHASAASVAAPLDARCWCDASLRGFTARTPTRW